MNTTLTRLGTIIYALVIGVFGFLHIKSATQMAGAIPDFIPASIHTALVYISGAAMILAGLAFLINKYARLAGILLAILLLLFAILIHLIHFMNGDQNSLGQILKETGLAAGAFIIAGCSRN